MDRDPDDILNHPRAIKREDTLRMLRRLEDSSDNDSDASSVDPDVVLFAVRRTVGSGAAGRGGKLKRSRVELDTFKQEKTLAKRTQAKQQRRGGGGRAVAARVDDAPALPALEGEKKLLELVLAEDEEEEGRVNDDDDDLDLRHVLHPDEGEADEPPPMPEPASSDVRHRQAAARLRSAQLAADEPLEATAIQLRIVRCDVEGSELVKVKPGDRWGKVARMLCEKVLHQDPRDVQFMLDCRPLDDTLTIDECNLADGDSVEMQWAEGKRERDLERELRAEVARVQQEVGEPITLRLRERGGEELEVTMQPTDRVRDLVQRYRAADASRAGVAFRVRFDGDICSDEQVLRALGLENDDLVDIERRS